MTGECYSPSRWPSGGGCELGSSYPDSPLRPLSAQRPSPVRPSPAVPPGDACEPAQQCLPHEARRAAGDLSSFAVRELMLEFGTATLSDRSEARTESLAEVERVRPSGKGSCDARVPNENLESNHAEQEALYASACAHPGNLAKPAMSPGGHALCLGGLSPNGLALSPSKDPATPNARRRRKQRWSSMGITAETVPV